MHCSLKIRFRSFIWFSIFTVTLCLILHLGYLLPSGLCLVPEAQADETQTPEAQPEGDQSPAKQEPSSGEPSSKEPPAAPTTTTTSVETGAPELGVSSLSLLVDDFTGAAHLNYPIVVPPGRKGVAPDLLLTYNSHRSNGWVGVGWNLDIGAIQRSTKYGVNYSANDYVAVKNGSVSELVTRGDWGANYYGNKIEGEFSKYFFNTSTGGWEITAKDGTKYYYGTTSASRQDNAYGVFKWCLDKMQDTNGNCMTLTYWKDQGEIYLDRIDYTGNGGVSPTNYVKFYPDPDPRTDVPLMYTTNSLVKTAHRLKTIETYSNGSLQRKYVLNYGDYSSSTSRSLLRALTVYGNDGISVLPDIGFEWTESGHFADQGAWATGKYAGWSANTDRIHFVDVTGDATADIILGPQCTYGNWYVMRSTGSSFTDDGAWATGKYASWCTTPDRIRFADVNGDGKTDVIIGPDGYGNWYVMLSTGGSFADQGTWATGKYGNWNASPSRIRAADVDGDGKADVILGPDANGKWFVMLSTGSSFADQGAWATGKYAGWSSATTRIHFADVNGDGKADITLGPQQTYGNWYVMLSTGSSFADQGAWATGKYAGWSANTDRTRFVDVNGDGKVDIILGPEMTTGNWYVMLSTGSSFADQGAWATGKYAGWYASGDRIRNADVNGDGKADIIMGPQCTYGNWYVMRSTGSSFTDDGAWATTGDYAGWCNTPDRIRNADVSGDGKADIILGPQQTYGNWFVILSDGRPPDLISTVSNGIRGTYAINYTPSSAYNNTLLPLVMQTVSSTSTDDGKGNVSTTTYTYSDGYFSYPSREFRGFGYVKTTDPAGTTKESWFLQDDIYKGLLDTQQVKDSFGILYAQTDNTYNHTSPYQGVEYPYLERKDDYVCDGQASCMQVQTNFAYDSYGNTTEKKLEGDIALEGDERYEYAEYNPCNLSKWIVNRPSRTWVTSKNGAMKAQTWLEYDNGSCDKGNLTKKTDWLSPGGTNPFTQYGYDAYGNQTSITDPKGNTTTTEFETTAYTYPFRTTIPYLNFTTEKTYNYGYGKVLTEKDYNGNITTYTYDEFGRKKTVTKPPDTTSYPTEVYSYPNFGTLGNPNPDLNQMVRVLLRKDANTSNQTWKETHFDGLGRTYLTRRENAPGASAICTATAYNDRGLVDGRSYPYFESSQYTYWTYFGYDAVARVTTTTTFNEAGNPITTTTIYDRDLTTTIDANKHAKVKEKDGLGRLIWVDEYSGTGTPQDPYQLYANTNYQYDPMGNLIKVIDAAGNQTTMVYDTLSRKTRMTDPDMCFFQEPNACYWNYQYDANGNLISQIDAKGQTILFSFFNPAIGGDDPLNRVMKKDYPTGTDIVYNYDQAGYDNPKGRLTSVTDSSGMTEFFYDERGRTKKTIQTFDAVSYTVETAFDSLDRIKSIKYPDLEIVSYDYDTAGNLSSVSGAENYVYVTYPNYNAQGQPTTNVQYGNGVTTSYAYSDYTNRLTSILTSRSGQTLQSLSYLYDDVGNVNTITDSIDPTRTQQFQYDHLNRLTQADSPAYPVRPITYQYNEIGNMTLNSQVGTYSYPSGYPLPLPHAVSQAGSNSYTYDENGNMETGAGRIIAYDYDNRPISITQGGVTGFVYDYQGQRVKKIGSSTTVYIGKLYEVTGGGYTKYIFAGTKRIANGTSSAVNYYHTDHLRSSNIITDASGSPVEAIYYFPYGQTRIDTGGPNVKHKYTGQELDSETGLYFYRARYYDPTLARFVSADSVSPDYNDPQSLNRYTYVRNNPLRYIDPTGHQYAGEDLLWGTDSLWQNSLYGPWSLDFRIMTNLAMPPLLNYAPATESVGTSGRLDMGKYTLYYNDGPLGRSPRNAGLAPGLSSGSSLSTYYGLPLTSFPPIKSTSNTIATIRGWNAVASGVSLCLICAPSGVTNAIGGAGFTATSGVGLALDFYEAYVTQTKPVSYFYTNALIGLSTRYVGRKATELGEVAAHYEFSVDRFRDSAGRFFSDELGIQGNQIKAASEAMGATATMYLEGYAAEGYGGGGE